MGILRFSAWRSISRKVSSRSGRTSSRYFWTTGSVKSMVTPSLPGLAWTHGYDFNPQVGNAALQFLRRAGELGEGPIMHGNYGLGTQQAASVASLPRTHGVVVADGQQGNIGLIDFVD